MDRIVKLMVLPANSIIGPDVDGVFRGWVDSTGDMTVEAPFTLDELGSVKVFMAFERLARADGYSPRGCAFVSPES